MACRECHIAKVKCDKVIPCGRCVRLSKVCVRHESRQGQGRAKKRARNKISEDAALSTEVGTLNPNHYGLHFLIRSWVSLSLRRRNFGLLARAGMIADRSGISMDQILCEDNVKNRRGMDFLYSILLTPAPQQMVVSSRLNWTEIPNTLLVATGCVGATDGLQDAIVSDRWIWIREVRQGISRYLVTPAFERDIADWSLIQQTYQENKKSVVELFLAPSDIPKHTKAFAHQVSIHSAPNLPRSSNRMKSRIKIKNKQRYSNVSSLDVDQVFCLDIQNLDHDFTYQEYIPRISAQLSNVNTTLNDNALGGMAGIINNNNNNKIMKNNVAQMTGAASFQHNYHNSNRNNSGNIKSNGEQAAAAAAIQSDRNSSNTFGVDADTVFKSGLDAGLLPLDLDAFDDDLDLDFFMNVLK